MDVDEDYSIQKISVYDDRVVQHPARYAIVKGANSINSMPFSAQTESSAQHQYTIQVPNQGVYMDRALLWSSTVRLQLKLAAAQPIASGATFPILGSSVSLAAFPLHRLVSVINGTINNQNVTFNCDVMEEVLRLADSPDNRHRRTCPTKLDFQVDYSGQWNSNPISGIQSQTSGPERPNGAYAQIYFTDSNFTIPQASGGSPGKITGTTSGGVSFEIDSLTQVFKANAAITAGDVIPLYITFRSTEKFLLSPLIFSELCERDTGIFGLNNIMLTLNMAPPSFTEHTGRVLRIDGSKWNTAVGSGSSISLPDKPYVSSRVDVQFLDPNWEVPLPTRSVVPYMDYSRYLTSQTVTVPTDTTGQLAGGSGVEVKTQTITLPYIPDMLVVSVRPASYDSASIADWAFPIEGVSLQWANRSGLLSTHTREQLYEMAYNNGLKMSYEEWCGRGKYGGANATGLSCGNAPLVGGFLVLRPGVDFVLDPQQAPGMVGNFVLQASVRVSNQLASTYSGQLRVCVLAVNSGFFATVYGSSTIMRGVLSPSDVIAKGSVALTQMSLNRLVGAGWWDGFKSKMGTALTAAKDNWGTIESIAKAAKKFVPEQHQGKYDNAVGAVGKLLTGQGAGVVGGGFSVRGNGHGYDDGAGYKRQRLGARIE